jgi:uncharacterized membrane protein
VTVACRDGNNVCSPLVATFPPPPADGTRLDAAPKRVVAVFVLVIAPAVVVAARKSTVGAANTEMVCCVCSATDTGSSKSFSANCLRI